jgi:proteasome accessory factor C
MADYFARPLRLTRSEALALYLEGKALLGTPGLPEAAALESALGKLEAALGPESLGGLAGRVEAAEPDDAPTGLLAEFREAAAGHRRLEIEYYAASTAETTVREVDPESVFSALGRWYVVAFDHRSEEERMFRLDRIRRAEPTGDSFEPRGLAGAGRPLYTRSGEDIEVRLRLAPGARWVAEYYVTDHVAERGDGSVDVTIPTKRLGWVARLVLRLGDAVEILAPDKLREGVRRAAGATLSAYGDVTP